MFTDRCPLPIPVLPSELFAINPHIPFEYPLHVSLK
jgi:hypothetical protein